MFPASFQRTLDVIRGRHSRVRTIDISELQKAEAGLTCMSIIFNNTVPAGPSGGRQVEMQLPIALVFNIIHLTFVPELYTVSRL